MDGVINVIEFLASTDCPQSILLDALSHICTVHGVYVNCRALSKDMASAIETTNLKPVVDEKVLDFADAKRSYSSTS